MKVTGIMYSTPMAQADDAGRKTQTRRTKGLGMVNENPGDWEYIKMEYLSINGKELHAIFINPKTGQEVFIKSPYGGPGDVLWRREANCFVMREHAADLLGGMKSQLVYKVGVHEDWMKYAKEKYGYNWKPAIHMPKEACRRWMRIKDIYPQRLQDIIEDDAIAEGVGLVKLEWDNYQPFYLNYESGEYTFTGAKDSFRTIIQSIHNRPGKQDVWEANPWEWRIVYEGCEMPAGFLEKKA